MSQPLPSSAASVVVPAFNAERTIGRTLSSILQQTVSPSEVIVVDDGSTDNTSAIVRALADPRIRVIGQENAGVSAARNYGWTNARNELIAFCDADDEWAPTFIATISRLADAYPSAVACATSYRVIPPDAPAYDARLTGLPFQGPDGIIADYFALAAQSDPPVHSSSVAIRRSALQRIGGFPHGVASGEDLLVWAKLAAAGQFAYCRLPLSTFNCPARLDFSRAADPSDPVGRGLEDLLASAPASLRPSIQRYLGRWHEMRTIVALGRRDPELARHHARRMVSNSGMRTRTLLLWALSSCPISVAYPLFSWARRNRAPRRLFA